MASSYRLQVIQSERLSGQLLKVEAINLNSEASQLSDINFKSTQDSQISNSIGCDGSETSSRSPEVKNGNYQEVDGADGAEGGGGGDDDDDGFDDDEFFNDLFGSQQHAKKLVSLRVRGIWVQNYLPKNCIIHIIDPIYNKKEDCLMIDNDRGLMVVEPDSLLTCTLIASSLFCERKTWLNQLFCGVPGTSKAMLVGTLVHEVFQYGVKNRTDNISELTKFADEELLDDATIMLECYSAESNLEEVRSEIVEYISSVAEWIRKYMLIGPPHPLDNDAKEEVKIIGVNDIEENVWSTKYGLKGKIDVTGSVRIHNKSENIIVDSILPLELKTGNPQPSLSHQAQVSLYSLMIEDRYKETNKGLLIYLKNKAAMYKVSLDHKVKRDLIQRRNTVNYHLKDFYYGPEMKDAFNLCQKCDSLSACIYVAETYNSGSLDQYLSMKKLRNEAVGHLEESFKAFFKSEHENLVLAFASQPTAESSINPKDEKLESSQSKFFWNYTSERAESLKIGYGNLVVRLSEESKKILIFKRNLKRKRVNSLDSLNDDQCKDELTKQFSNFDSVINSRVAVSVDSQASMTDSNSTTAILIGYVQKIENDMIVFKVYEGSVDAIKPLQHKTFRIDRLIRRPRLDIERSILTRLLEKENWRVANIRRFLVDKSFKPDINPEYNLLVISKCFDIVTQLHEPYQQFITEAVCTDNYYAMSDNIAPTKWSDMNKISYVLTKLVLQLERSMLIVTADIDKLLDLMVLLDENKVPFRLVDDGSSLTARQKFDSKLIRVSQDKDMNINDKYSAYINQHNYTSIFITTYSMAYAGLQFSVKTFDYCLMFDFDSIKLLPSLGPMFCCDRSIILNTNKLWNPDSSQTIASNDCNLTLQQHMSAMKMI